MDKIYHCILTYNNILIFFIFQIEFSSIIFLINIESMFSLYFLSQSFEAVKEVHNFFRFRSTEPPLIFYLLVIRSEKIHVNVYQQSKLNYTHHLFFPKTINLSSYCQQVRTRIEAYFKSNIYLFLRIRIIVYTPSPSNNIDCI